MAKGEIIRWKKNFLTGGGGDEERTNNQKQSQES